MLIKFSIIRRDGNERMILETEVSGEEEWIVNYQINKNE